MKLSDLQHELRQADPAAILVSPRVLDRVIRQEHQLPNVLWRVPHRHCYVVDRHVLFRHVEQDELSLESDRLLPSTVLLLAQPSSEELAADSGAVWMKYWRLLFHAKLHLALQTRCDEGKLPPAAVRERIEELGNVPFTEIRRVLTEDGYLLPDADDRAVYIEFAAVFFELQYFAVSVLPAFFPTLYDSEAVQRLLSRDVDAAELFRQSRLASAPDPVEQRETSSDEAHAYFWKLAESAERASQEGNTVRAAILRTRAARVAPAAQTAETRLLAEADLQRLVARLGAALQLTEAQSAQWLKTLPQLLDRADQGYRPVEAALLFELQKVCLDQERESFALDLIEWLRSAGQKPIKRPLPSQRVVRKVKHLRSAVQLLARARLSDADRDQLGRLLQAALDGSEKELRDRFRPILTETFQDVGMVPASPPERVAFNKMIDELLDRIAEYGFLTFGDLRDAISRNQLKLPDLAEAYDFLEGDPLLRLDKRLSTLLDGVYRPAEAYLRWLEWFTAIGFGTATGRLITRFVVLPFGGSFLFVESLVVLLTAFDLPPMLDMVRYSLIVTLGLFLLGLLHVPSFRQRCKELVLQFGNLLYMVFIGWPARALKATGLRDLVRSWAFRWLSRYLIKPLAACAILHVWIPEAFAGPLYAVLTFLAANFVLNSRLGLATSEAIAGMFVQFWELLQAGLLPGLIRFILRLFKQITDMLEYLLFVVDEWLSFRSGDSRILMAVRTVLGLLWFPVSYLARFYMVVLIEPGLNPIKFPVSALAAKFIYPLYGVLLTTWLVGLLSPIVGALIAAAFAGTTVWLLPDAFGFLFWEMKENWRLYRANRSPDLRPVSVGPHGETIPQLLQPGFHSGTLPKLFARLRHAERAAAETGNWQVVRVCRQDLHKVERTLQRLFDREVVELVEQSPHWKGQPLVAGRVLLASNRISLELVHPAYLAESLWIELEDQGHWLVAGFRAPSWLLRVSPEQRQVVTIAVAGFYKLAGVDLVREQLAANLPPEGIAYDITPSDLVVWLDRQGERAIHYEWKSIDGLLDPRTEDGVPAPEFSVLDGRKLIFGRVSLPWEQWVQTWKLDQNGQVGLAPFTVPSKLVPLGQPL